MPKLNLNRLLSEIKKISQKQGACLFGIADIQQIKGDFQLSSQLKEKLKRAIVLGLRVSKGILEELETHPTRLYFHHYRLLNAYLDQLALSIARCLEEKGFLAIPIPASQILDWQKQTAHLSHKKLGVLAGLGWIGRNNLLVNKKFGSQFRLVSILTDAPLKAHKPVKGDCGSCFACLEVCPAKAIKKDVQNFDYLACFAQLKEFQKQRFTDQYICGLCVKACKGTVSP